MKEEYPIIRLGLAITLLIAAKGIKTYDSLRKEKLYDRAESKAAQIYGDHLPPLSESERVLWYKDLNIEKNKRPTRNQLENFLFNN